MTFDHYSIAKRIGYASRNNWFLRIEILNLRIPMIPTDQDIYLHNAWKDVKKKHERNKIGAT